MNHAADAKAAMIAALAEIGVPVVAHWETVSGGTLDHASGKMVGGSVTSGMATVQMLRHDVRLESAARTYGQLKVGDLILDYNGDDLSLDGKEGLFFTVGGRDYVQKKVGDLAADFPDATVGGTELLRTIILTPRG